MYTDLAFEPTFGHEYHHVSNLDACDLVAEITRLFTYYLLTMLTHQVAFLVVISSARLMSELPALS